MSMHDIVSSKVGAIGGTAVSALFILLPNALQWIPEVGGFTLWVMKSAVGLLMIRYWWKRNKNVNNEKTKDQ